MENRKKIEKNLHNSKGIFLSIIPYQPILDKKKVSNFPSPLPHHLPPANQSISPKNIKNQAFLPEVDVEYEQN
jgi:hypothetical protein